MMNSITFNQLAKLVCIGGVFILLLFFRPSETKNYPEEKKADKWVVVTSINHPTSAIKALAAQEDWKVVVVADTKTPTDWEYEGVTILSVERQKQLGYEILKYIPYRTYARKNIGYLYAIQHGAQIIYETDDDNELLMDISDAFDSNLVESMPFYSTKDKTVNPYPTFGQPSIWPRGYPLSMIAKDPCTSFSNKTKVSVAIQQGLANGDPDVDAIYRLTRKSTGKKIDISFASLGHGVGIPHSALVPFNSQNTLFHYNAFWGLYIPITTNFRVCDIWRGYWSQRLLHEIDSHLGFYKPSVYQDRNEHDYSLDYADEIPLYNDAERLVDFLLSWKAKDKELIKKIKALSRDMAQHGFWKAHEAKVINAWLSDLKKVGYTFPISKERTVSEDDKPFEIPITEHASSFLRCPHCLMQPVNKQ